MGEAVLSDDEDLLKNQKTESASDATRASDSNDPDLKEFLSFARTFLMPMIVMKVFLLYFGLNYSQYPGEGYGYGLVATLVVIAASFSYFLWSQRNKT